MDRTGTRWFLLGYLASTWYYPMSGCNADLKKNSLWIRKLLYYLYTCDRYFRPVFIISLKIFFFLNTKKDRENYQRPRQVKYIIRISQSPQVMSRNREAYNLSNILQTFVYTGDQSSGKQSMTSQSQCHSLTMVLDENPNCRNKCSFLFG